MANGLIADLIDLGGAGLEVVDLGQGVRPADGSTGMVRVGVHRGGPPPHGDLDSFDILLSVDAVAEAPWVTTASLEETLDRLAAVIARQPVAAAAAAQLLRVSLKVSFDEALALESLAYSMLLAAEGFATWRAANPARERPLDEAPRVSLEAREGSIEIRLARPTARNAFDARMRDALCEALVFALDHPDIPPVLLRGEGPSFSAGGDLDEFGRASDPGAAHLIRGLRAPAALARRLGDRLTVRVHGACIGAGIEIPAAAGRVIATPDAVFRLPEVSMGLVPGAGGIASIPRRVGRQRACFMAISGADLDAPTALAWGLVDEVEA